MPKRKKEEEQLERLYEQLAESVLSLSDSDLLSVYGESAQRDADSVSRLVQQATTAVRKKKLTDAKGAYEQQVATIRAKRHNIPENPQKRIELLMSVVAKQPNVRNVLTAQFRDFKEMSEADVESALKQLFDLGLLK